MTLKLILISIIIDTRAGSSKMQQNFFQVPEFTQHLLQTPGINGQVVYVQNPTPINFNQDKS